MRSRRARWGWLVAPIALCVSTASAADPAHDPIAAEAIFNAAVKALKEGDTATACAKFQASLDLDPAVSTHLQLAKCHERDGKLARAWYEYESALKLNREKADPRKEQLEALAKRGLAALEPRVPKLRVVVDAPPPGLTIDRGGAALPTSALGEALPADPGEIEIEARAPGFTSVKKRAQLVEGQTTEVRFTLIAEAKPLVATHVEVAPAQLAPANVDRSAPPASHGGRRALGIVVGGVGILGVGAAAVLAGVTVARVGESKGDSPDLCDDNDVCGPRGTSLRSGARATQTAAIVTGSASLVAVGVGAVLLATSGSSVDAKVAVSLSPRGAFVFGAF